jgi:hypothetical protein
LPVAPRTPVPCTATSAEASSRACSSADPGWNLERQRLERRRLGSGTTSPAAIAAAVLRLVVVVGVEGKGRTAQGSRVGLVGEVKG